MKKHGFKKQISLRMFEELQTLNIKNYKKKCYNKTTFNGSTIRYPKFARNDLCGCKHCIYCNKKIDIRVHKKIRLLE